MKDGDQGMVTYLLVGSSRIRRELFFERALASIIFFIVRILHQRFRIAQEAFSTMSDMTQEDSSFLKPLKLILFIIEYIPMRLLALTIASLKASKKSMHYIKTRA